MELTHTTCTQSILDHHRQLMSSCFKSLILAWQRAATGLLQQMMCSPVLRPAGSCRLHGTEIRGGAGAATDGAQPGVLVAPHVQAGHGARGLGSHPIGILGLHYHQSWGQGQRWTSPAAVLATAHLQRGTVPHGSKCWAGCACTSRCLTGQESQLLEALVVLKNNLSFGSPLSCQ